MVPGITNIFVKNYMEQCLDNILEMGELTDIISCVLLMHMENRSHHMLMSVVAVMVMFHHQVQQHKH